MLGIGLFVYAGVLVWIALTGPDRLPAHLGADGDPTRWASKAWVLFFAGLTALVLLAVILGCRVLVTRAGTGMLSLPSARATQYWSASERRPELNRRLISDLELIFGATFLLLAWVMGGLVRAADGSGDPTLTPVILIYTAVLAAVTLAMFLGPRYRAPDGWTHD